MYIKIKELIKKNFYTIPVKKFFLTRQFQVLNFKHSNRFKLNPFMLKPFTIADLKSVPEEWSIGKPDFVGVGVQKAGTTWWHSLLLEHPQVVNNRLEKKELHYFNHFHFQGLEQKDISLYHQAFARPEGTVCGEWSPSYLSNSICAKYLAEAAPNTKILILLRNPIDCMLSGLNQMLYARLKYFDFTPNQSYIYELFYLYPEGINSSLYAQSIKQLLRYFNRDQIILLQYEKCKINPQQEIARTYKFLGIDEQYQPQNIQRLVHKRKYVIPPLKPKERQHLAEYFTDDVRSTVKMFPEIDITLWEDFDIL